MTWNLPFSENGDRVVTIDLDLFQGYDETGLAFATWRAFRKQVNHLGVMPRESGGHPVTPRLAFLTNCWGLLDRPLSRAVAHNEAFIPGRAHTASAARHLALGVPTLINVKDFQY